MKNLVLASALGTLAGAFAIPAIGGPVHFAVTRPYSLFGWTPPGNGASYQNVTVTLGTVPLDFILTDVMLSTAAQFEMALVLVNGAPVFNLGSGPSGSLEGSTHLTSGIFIPGGSVIAFQVKVASVTTSPVTLAGYLQ